MDTFRKNKGTHIQEEARNKARTQITNRWKVDRLNKGVRQAHTEARLQGEHETQKQKIIQKVEKRINQTTNRISKE
jgi:hypothetical protein